MFTETIRGSNGTSVRVRIVRNLELNHSELLGWKPKKTLGNHVRRHCRQEVCRVLTSFQKGFPTFIHSSLLSMPTTRPSGGSAKAAANALTPVYTPGNGSADVESPSRRGSEAYGSFLNNGLRRDGRGNVNRYGIFLNFHWTSSSLRNIITCCSSKNGGSCIVTAQ